MGDTGMVVFKSIKKMTQLKDVIVQLWRRCHVPREKVLPLLPTKTDSLGCPA
jgi:hypothetical protein